MMESSIVELQKIIKEYTPKFKNISEADLNFRPAATKWSRKEVIGHLIDSAHSNLRRFIAGQYEGIAPHIVYNQDFWVIANSYHTMSSEDIIALWKLMNERVVAVLSNMPAENYKRECNTSKYEPQLRTLEWLAEDYVKHLKHHINQIIPGAFDIVYP